MVITRGKEEWGEGVEEGIEGINDDMRLDLG